MGATFVVISRERRWGDDDDDDVVVVVVVVTTGRVAALLSVTNAYATDMSTKSVITIFEIIQGKQGLFFFSMEIVGKRKKEVNDQERFMEDREMPPQVLEVLSEKESKARRALQYLDTHRLNELKERRLMPHQIRDQAYESLGRHNTPRQIMSVVNFLYDHQNVVILGEKLPPMSSVFCRVPFSKKN